MPSGLTRWIVATLLLTIFPASTILAQTQGAIVYSASGVKVNGREISGHTAIFVGDRVEAKDNATIVVNGASVVLAPGSSLTYATDAVTLDAGNAIVRANKGFQVHVGNVVITPQDATQFAIVRDKSGVKVSAKSGSLSLFNGKESVVVTGGNSYVAGVDQAPTLANLPAAAKSMDHDKELAIAIFSGIAAGVALGICNFNHCFDDSSPASP